MGTKADRKRIPLDDVPRGGPAIILVKPQLGENIGTAARAMFNCGLTDLRVVAPRDGWPSEKAQNAASGALAVVEEARVFERTEEAIRDLHHVYATTARRRGMVKAVLPPRVAATEIRAAEAAGERVGILFGAERKGLENDDLALSAKIIEAPLNPVYTSLNLAQAVLLVSYEWWIAGEAGEVGSLTPKGGTRAADGDELMGFFEHLERELDESGFLYPPQKRPAMVRNIRNMFQRARLTEQEVRTLRGIVAALSHGRHRK